MLFLFPVNPHPSRSLASSPPFTFVHPTPRACRLFPSLHICSSRTPPGVSCWAPVYQQVCEWRVSKQRPRQTNKLSVLLARPVSTAVLSQLLTNLFRTGLSKGVHCFACLFIDGGNENDLTLNTVWLLSLFDSIS